MFIAIAAIAENYALGKNNDLLWHLPNDFKRFKTLTSGHHIIMGRKTFESFPKPLPHRTHVVISKTEKDHLEQVIFVKSLEEAFSKCPINEDVYIIGGGQIYKQALEFCDKLELTIVHHTFEDADTFFPTFDKTEWTLTFEEFHPADEKHQFAFTFKTFERKIAI
jgi:dihydrofolate reductase